MKRDIQAAEKLIARIFDDDARRQMRLARSREPRFDRRHLCFHASTSAFRLQPSPSQRRVYSEHSLLYRFI